MYDIKYQKQSNMSLNRVIHDSGQDSKRLNPLLNRGNHESLLNH